MKRKVASGTTLTLLLTSVFVSVFLTTSVEASPAISSVQPLLSIWSDEYKSHNITDLALTLGSEFQISVNVTDVTNLKTYDFYLYYDTAILDVIAATVSGTWFDQSGYTYWANVRKDDNAGRIHPTVWLGSANLSGSGALLYVTFKVAGFGVSSLDIQSDSLLDPYGHQIPHATRDGVFRNQLEKPLVADFTKSPAPCYYDTSEYLIGSVAVGIILPDSIEGLYDWTETEINQTVTGIIQAMNWWASQESNAHLHFSYDIHTQVPITYEPILMALYDDYVWINDGMSQLGYTLGYPWEKVQAYNNDIRTAYGTDWAFTIFVVDCDPSRAEGQFLGGGGYAHAYLGGPWITMSRYSSWAWNAGSYHVAVPAHEMGHIFYATDEYNYVPERSGYLNISDSDGGRSLMNRNDLTLSTSTRGQVGWRDLDGDGILDIIDTYPEIALNAYPNPIFKRSYTFSGAVVEVPYPNSNPFGPRNNVTINKIVSVEYALDDGAWTPASSNDGRFDEPLENFTLAVSFATNGSHYIKIRATNSVGNSRERVFSVETVLPSPISASVRFEPECLNSMSRGRWITAYIWLSQGYSVCDIDIATIRLNDIIQVDPQAPVTITNYDNDAILDLMVKFDRREVIEYIHGQNIEYGNVRLKVSGKLTNGTSFEGFDVIRLVIPGDVNRDDEVDILDLALIAKALGTDSSHSEGNGWDQWNPDADVNQDNKVDVQDMAITGINYGKTIP